MAPRSATTGAGDRATPAALGYRMPAEWEPHARTWMMWPCRTEVWPDLEATKRAYAEVARTIRAFEPVTMAARPEDAGEARQLLGAGIDVVAIPIDDSWSRDAGPCFLLDAGGTLAGASFRFNAWGGKYRPYDRDDAFADALLGLTGARAFASPLVAEGGGISVDGEGTLLTTESCFPNANRNPGWSRNRIEAELKAMTGATKVIWLPGDPDETETDGHVDGIAVFARPGVVLIEDPGPPGSPMHDAISANIAALRGQTDAKGRPIELVLVGEAAEAESASARFCRSYVNSYLVNGGVIMPLYGTPSDEAARAVLARLFPDRRVAGVPVGHIAIGGGGIHCITQQQPAQRKDRTRSQNPREAARGSV